MKYLIAFLAGAATGVLATYLYFNNKIDNKINEKMQEFIDVQKAAKAPEKVEPQEVEEDEPLVSPIPDTTEKTSIVEMENIIRTEYRKDNDGIEEKEDDDEEYITDEEMNKLILTSQQRMSEKPHVITEEERELCRGYDWVEFNWYPEENLLVEVTHDEPIEEPEIYFGAVDWRNILKDKPEITIRDSHEATDYTIYNNDIYRKENN